MYRYLASFGLFLAALVALPVHATAPPGRYSAADGVVKDWLTGLEWQQTVSGTHTFSEAATYCAGLPLDGGGFRVPTVKELLTLVDHSAGSPSVDGIAFPSSPSTGFWSSTARAESTSKWFVDFSDKGSTTGYDPATPMNVRCVR
jgi:hypothetical protein